MQRLFPRFYHPFRADLAQHAEQLTCNLHVSSSIPVIGAIQQESILPLQVWGLLSSVGVELVYFLVVMDSPLRRGVKSECIVY